MKKLILVAIFIFFGVVVIVFSNDDARVWGNNSQTTEETPKVLPKNEWFPIMTGKESDQLQLGAKSALVVDYDSGQVLFNKNAGQKLPAGSTIKIMTALLTLESADLERKFSVSAKAAMVGENAMGLTEGENVKVRDLLYGTMLVSGNDAAVTLAENIAGSEDAFVVLMNKRARELGLGNTKFVNASGLDVDGQSQYTTSLDLASLAYYVWEHHPIFREISSTDHVFIEANSDHKVFDLYNDTNLLTTYPGVKGIKPGFTWEAGLCLVTYAENDGKRLLAVILGSENRRGEMVELLDYGFSNFGITISHPGLDLK